MVKIFALGIPEQEWGSIVLGESIFQYLGLNWNVKHLRYSYVSPLPLYILFPFFVKPEYSYFASFRKMQFNKWEENIAFLIRRGERLWRGWVVEEEKFLKIRTQTAVRLMKVGLYCSVLPVVLTCAEFCFVELFLCTFAEFWKDVLCKGVSTENDFCALCVLLNLQFILLEMLWNVAKAFNWCLIFPSLLFNWLCFKLSSVIYFVTHTFQFYFSFLQNFFAEIFFIEFFISEKYCKYNLYIKKIFLIISFKNLRKAEMQTVTNVWNC